VTRVLVVEDEESYSDALSYMLRKEGFEVAVAATGPDALVEFDRAGADIVLLDQMLPDMSGIDVARRLRAEHPVLPIVFVSGHAEPEMLRDAVPGVRLLRKPFQTEELYAEVRRNLDLRRQTAK
jgi:two-component system response regulator RegX3